ncbi:hypothetical protein EVAR_57796_1 [Eumeta japonica]|uniref:Uncharacterized protein n=1 Tax=Eumeta variegata TaxID=151549 RepID=A0A4C1Y530_EUMVA|nr:hypothetical protein EVAR_57796_1 [Eumeta japonica]
MRTRATAANERQVIRDYEPLNSFQYTVLEEDLTLETIPNIMTDSKIRPLFLEYVEDIFRVTIKRNSGTHIHTHKSTNRHTNYKPTSGTNTPRRIHRPDPSNLDRHKHERRNSEMRGEGKARN